MVNFKQNIDFVHSESFSFDGHLSRERPIESIYAARTAQVYRRAIDDAVAGKAFNPELLLELDGLSNRGYTEGFLQRHKPQELQNYEHGHSQATSQQLVGEVLEQLADDYLLIDVKNNFKAQDQLLLLSPTGNYQLQWVQLLNVRHEPIDVAPGSGHRVHIRLPFAVVGAQAMLVKILVQH